MKYLFLLIAICITGCSTLINKGSTEVANAVNIYCQETDLMARSVIRAEVNAKLEGKASIVIVCEGD